MSYTTALKGRSLPLTPTAHRVGGNRDHWLYDRSPGHQRPLPDIDGRVMISRRSEAALNTEERALRGTVFFGDMAAVLTLARCVAGVNLLHPHAGQSRLVEQEGLELVESPV